MLTAAVGAVLGAFRGGRRAMSTRWWRAVLGLSRLFLHYRDVVSDIEINPLMIGAAGEA